MILTISTTQPSPNQCFCWGKFWHFFDLKIYDFNMNKQKEFFVKETALICQTWGGGGGFVLSHGD
jgi:hypothetical protein